jgi:hypothetical protein
MEQEPLKFVGTYVTEELYYKLKFKCAMKCSNISKALISLIMIYTKDVKLEDYETPTKDNNEETKSD